MFRYRISKRSRGTQGSWTPTKRSRGTQGSWTPNKRSRGTQGSWFPQAKIDEDDHMTREVKREVQEDQVGLWISVINTVSYKN